MLLLKTEEINKFIGARQLLKDISVQIYDKDRIGLVGRNGCGKSTFLKIINGEEQDYSGEVNLKAEAGYLPQYYTYKLGQTVESFITEYTYDYGAFLKLMKQFGLPTEFLDRNIAQCSGGEQTKLQLIRLLVTEPDLLILDEPTNHLDIKARDWLQKFINDFPGGVLIVSHDRHFLNEVIDKVWEIERGELNEYSGNYSDYSSQKEIEQQRAWQQYQQYQAEKKRLKESINKQQQHINKADKGRKRTDSFWRELKGSDRRTGQMAQKVNALGSQIEQLEKKDKPFQFKNVNFDLVPGQQIHSDILIEGKDIDKKFDDQYLFKNLNFTIRKGDKIALLGDNGIGKTTLLNNIRGQEPINRGELNCSSVLKIGYLSQKLSNLDLKQTVLQEIKNNLPHLSEQVIRTFLGCLLFTGDDVYKIIGDLSIGERVRVALTKLILSKINLLLLDEPMNHLDITARERVEQTLQDYPGTLLFISHDRYFIEKVATEIWELTDNNLICFHGSYQEFQKQQDQGENTGNSEEDTLVIRMKRAELTAKLSQTEDVEEKEEIEEKLKEL